MESDPRKNEPEPPVPPPLPRRGSEEPRPPHRALTAWLVVFFLISVMIFALNSDGYGGYKELENEGVFRQLVVDGKIEKVELVRESSGKTMVRGIRTGKDGDETGLPKRFTLSVMPDTQELQQFMRAHDVNMRVNYSNPIWGALLVQIVPILIFLGLLYFIFIRQARASGMGAMNFGKSRAKMLNQEKPKITFANVAGIEEAKDEVAEIIEFLKAPQKFVRLGGRIPKGVLLMGPPGTGKTLLAKAIAGEAGVPFFSISGSDFVEMFVGVGASRVRDMFEQGKKHAPCIIFIDEIDAVGRSRFTGIGGGHDEREQTLNALLVEMDGFETSDGVIIVAATNRPDVLDPALLRPGRFDRQIVIDLPSMKGREEILGIHAKKLKLAPEVELSRIARGTPGFSGADLANLLNEAALMAARVGKDGIEQEDLEEARDKVWWGRERKSRVLDNDEKRLTAYHEAGHAVVMALVEGGEPIHKVTIIPRGMALGATMFLPEKDRLHFTRTQMLAQLATAMGGRVAEEIFLDDISAGASQDLLQATNLARRMVCDWGMSEELGPRTFGRREEMMFLGREVGRTQDFSEATAQKIDAEVDAILRQAYQKAHDILTSHRERVEALVVMLLEQETVDGEDAEDLIKLGRFRSQEEREADRKAREAAARARAGLPPLDEAGDDAKADGETAAKADGDTDAGVAGPPDVPPQAGDDAKADDPTEDTPPADDAKADDEPKDDEQDLLPF
ncbi:MAG: ATP-dependent zinc metalloprotease FtsH [Kiritimatiellia bacterium]|jgi:cell division protease FtsH